ncbi:hypothetical protein NADFUDRAFT_82077 [Nadsonia fulvescens var. elongata DSM 6958]|uniref:HIG1 domain-containing protein n=1 Tax=Nadsonia fulvescens var. elongata DSM 6958 TaxID=857566 RepID=A0A1E3PQY7_9ASCO|nr:hypothetical protein NADFUDRAFT_82077 [Nadsonia fulvescens var. elongata DSM 6958]
MKLASNEEVNEYGNALTIGAIKGLAIGSVISAGLMYGLKKKFPTGFKELTYTARTFFALAPALAVSATLAEHASLKFDRERYASGDARPEAVARQKQIDSLGFSDKLMYYGSQHKYKIIVSAWAASLGASWWYVNRDKIMTPSQKIVQARMYAQAVTVAILLGAMAVNMADTSVPLPESDEQQLKDSWVKILEEEEQRLSALENQKQAN